MNSMRILARVAVVLLVLGIGVAIAAMLIQSRSTAETVTPNVPPPLVEVVSLAPSNVELSVEANGTVRAPRSTTLIAELGGKIVEVTQQLEVGAFFDEGDVLARIDPRDYELAVVRSRADIASAEQALEFELAEAASSVEEWKETAEGPAPPLVRREPQVAAARARVEAAKAALEVSERDLERTTIRAPYPGRVRSKSVDLGQYVTPGATLAEIYAVDYAEIRLPLQDGDLAFLDLPIDYRDASDQERGPEVTIRGRFGGAAHEWHGRIVRTEGELDPTSRMLHAIARVEDPYARGQENGGHPTDRPPLLVGMFVDATIHGITAGDVFVIPRAALHEDSMVWIVDEMDRLRVRSVETLRLTRDLAYLRAGVAKDERLCLTRLESVIDGMLVRIKPTEGDR
ncbi:MAG: efflux RND transporter periplasmic adaptor subunit [Planctomycetes bacterium]|nr:efflux RND transporter periplasmic adaptor subunit [Planctomycetota bacterium]